MKMIDEENRMFNFGYCFVTYSHADEAKLSALMMEKTLMDNMILEISPKGGLDHKDFDKLYKTNRMKNDSKLIDELQRLRESKKELRDFEANLDKELPSLNKLKEFRSMARDVIENKPGFTREDPSNKRTKAEEEALNEKIRALQKENPDIDYT